MKFIVQKLAHIQNRIRRVVRVRMQAVAMYRCMQMMLLHRRLAVLLPLMYLLHCVAFVPIQHVFANLEHLINAAFVKLLNLKCLLTLNSTKVLFAQSSCHSLDDTTRTSHFTNFIQFPLFAFVNTDEHCGNHTDTHEYCR